MLAPKATQDLEAKFKYELCSYHPGLFESPFLLREAQKPVLADAIWSLLQTPNIPAVSGQVQYVLDGGALPQRIPWKKGVTYSEILDTYTEYVTRKYGHAIFVFDGYLNSPTKDMTHQRRLKSKIGATVTCTEEKKNLTMTKSEFLMNKINKQRFVNMLGETLDKNNCKSYYASADADLLIVLKAVESATTMKTVLVGDDTDLLVLLCYHASLDICNLLSKPEPPPPPPKCQGYPSLRYTSCKMETRGESMQSYSIS